VGLSFSRTNHEHVDARQLIVVASFLTDSRVAEVDFRTSTWLQQQLRNNHLRLSPKTFFLLAWHQYDRKDRTVRNICAYMAKQRFDIGRMFPSPEELEYAQQKFGDIRALDQTAKCGPGRWYAHSLAIAPPVPTALANCSQMWSVVFA
jgi:hypothetical protein